MAQLDDGADPCGTCRSFRDEQRPQRFCVPVTGLRDRLATARQGAAGGFDGVELIALAVLATFAPIGPIHLDHRHRRPREVAGDAGTVGAGS